VSLKSLREKVKRCLSPIGPAADTNLKTRFYVPCIFKA
jgi:hypothetical protein